MLTFWNEFLYRPLFNGLIWIYNNWTDQSLGWAIVYLTVLLRTAILPLTLIAQRNEINNDTLAEEIEELEKSFPRDKVAMNEEIRKLLRQKKVSPWAKIFSLGIQGLVLVLLYQVFVQGITGERVLQILYPTVEFPGIINSVFFGFELGEPRDILWPAIVGIWLFLEIYISYKRSNASLEKGDLAHFILFPVGVFLVLWWLPLVKTLFVLTSMAFSAIVGQFSKVLFAPTRKEKRAKKKEEKTKKAETKSKK